MNSSYICAGNVECSWRLTLASTTPFFSETHANVFGSIIKYSIAGQGMLPHMQCLIVSQQALFYDVGNEVIWPVEILEHE